MEITEPIVGQTHLIKGPRPPFYKAWIVFEICGWSWNPKGSG